MLERTIGADVEVGAARGRAETPTSSIGRYAVLHELGRGQMGIVLACYDSRLGRRVALKLLRSDRSSANVRVRMVREARAMAKLSHPNVAQVYEVGEANGRVFVAMEYIHGKTLRQWARTRRHDWREVLAHALAAARGLAAAHAHGLVHRDFKPDNVMVGDDGRVRVMDFGLVRFDDRTTLERDDDTTRDPSPMLTQRGAVLGTPAYMAPEQIRDAESGPAADQFAFCVTLWEMLFGTRPFAGPDLEAFDAQVRRDLPEPSAGRHGVPRWLRRVLEDGLAYDPRDRHASMSALIRALERGSMRARLRGLACAGLVALAYVGFAAVDRDLRAKACEGDARAWIDSVGEAPQRAAIAGLRATPSPLADATADAVAPFLATQAEALRSASASACLAAEVEHTTSTDLYDRATWCLAERRDELAAVLDAFARSDVGLLADAVAEASSLEPVARCLDDDALLRAPLPPAERRDEVRALQAKIAAENVVLQRAPDDRAARLGALADAVDATGWDPLRARLRLLIGRASWFDGDIEDAQRMLADAYFIAAAARDWTTAARAAISQIELCGRWLRRRDEGLAWAEHAEVALAKAADPLGLREAVRLVAISSVHEIEGDAALARTYIERAVAIEEPILPWDHPRLAARLDQLGVVAGDAGDYDTMLAACSRALAIRESVFGEHHSETMGSLINVGSALHSTGAYARSRAVHERALAIAERTERPDSLVFGMHHANLGMVASGLGEHETARAHLERAIAIREGTLGPDHPAVGKALRLLGEALLAAGDVEGARAQLERALSIHEAALGREHVDVAQHMQFLASAHAAAGARTIAEQLSTRAGAIVVAATGAGSVEHANALEREVMILRDGGSLDRARQVAQTCVGMREHNLGAEHPSTAFMLAVLGELELDLGDFDAAREHLERADKLFADRAVASDAEHATRFALARALEATGGDRVRAHALAISARDGWRELRRTRELDLALVESWLQENAPP